MSNTDQKFRKDVANRLQGKTLMEIKTMYRTIRAKMWGVPETDMRLKTATRRAMVAIGEHLETLIGEDALFAIIDEVDSDVFDVR